MKTAAHFLGNEELWHEVQTRAAEARAASAAIAYLGQHGARLLPLRKGHKLVVDMSLGAVRQGVTDPREIRKLMKRGVQVFSRASLHAKFLIMDKTLIVGSANVSQNSQQTLDEAGILTSDPVAIRRATRFFEALCTEPVRNKYLQECIAAYRPPTFKAANASPRSKSQHRVVKAKLWFIGGLTPMDPPKEAVDSFAKMERKAEKKLHNPESTSVSWIRYHHKPRCLDHVRIGDWVVECSRDSVSPPFLR